MSQKHHVLIVGVGSIGQRHLRCFQATGRACASIVEIDPALRSKISEQYHVPNFSTLDEALAAGNAASARPDLAVIATPAHLHIPLATQAAAAGLHVLVEKPLATGTDGAGRLAQVAAERGVVVAVAYVYRCFPALAAMRAALLSGRFGRPVELVAVCGQHFPTYRPAYRDTYYTDRATGGGAIQDALTHLFNAGQWLVGPIDRLVADAAHRVLADVVVEDTAHVLARHGEVLASYSLNQHQAPNEITQSVICEHGTVRWESHHELWRWMSRPDEPWHDEPHERLPRDAAFVAQANNFLDAIAGFAPPLCSLAEGLQTLRVNLAALASVETGRWQTVGGDL
jgi:predicted dehydrogenase